MIKDSLNNEVVVERGRISTGAAAWRLRRLRPWRAERNASLDDLLLLRRSRSSALPVALLNGEEFGSSLLPFLPTKKRNVQTAVFARFTSSWFVLLPLHTPFFVLLLAPRSVLGVFFDFEFFFFFRNLLSN